MELQVLAGAGAGMCGWELKAGEGEGVSGVTRTLAVCLWKERSVCGEKPLCVGITEPKGFASSIQSKMHRRIRAAHMTDPF